MASVGSWIVGSGTLSTRTSRLPCHATAFISSYLRSRVDPLCRWACSNACTTTCIPETVRLHSRLPLALLKHGTGLRPGGTMHTRERNTCRRVLLTEHDTSEVR